MSTLSPFDISGLGKGFGLFRPRRPSYTYATQTELAYLGQYGRQRTESYRYAVRKSTSDPEEQSDFIEGLVTNRRNRKESYLNALKSDENSVTLQQVREPIIGNNIPKVNVDIVPRHSKEHISELKTVIAERTSKCEPLSVCVSEAPKNDEKANEIITSGTPMNMHGNNVNELQRETETPVSELSSNVPSVVVFTFRKNLVFLCISFIMLFSAFRAIQNLQSSINTKNHLGIISMACLHGTMFLTCLWAPSMINKVSAKWAIVCGMCSFLIWTGANIYPKFYTLIPSAVFCGCGQGILWTAEVSYVLKLAFDSSKITRNGLDKQVFRFHGIFLACFQTTHIWGNLLSSLIFQYFEVPATLDLDYGQMTDSNYSDVTIDTKPCGVLYPCIIIESEQKTGLDSFPVIWKLMCAYLVIAFMGFCLIFFCLDRIGARIDPEKTGRQIFVQHVTLLTTHKTFRLLIPLLIFSGLQQGFVFADFNQAYVTCALGEKYVGYSMIVMGAANVLGAIVVAICAKHIPREVVFAIGGIIHMGIMIGFLIWIPDQSKHIHFLLAASWGVCDAVWQTQCNTLICITCVEEADIAFANYRMLQAFGLMFAFLSGTFMCVEGKLYMLMIVLVIAIMFYVLAEYKVRQVENDVFDEPANE
ncbi:protein unc-93 homolog A-like [Mytilus californianus]|uniref:protein unc-93 homolog A-like n=1 Tax=Mytilus californianus TaxID=6549 RepID=UPI0022480D48|nr:protein unc-93 homolog A-like [Mytilus californianus]